jgi:hypothetical protein
MGFLQQQILFFFSMFPLDTNQTILINFLHDETFCHKQSHDRFLELDSKTPLATQRKASFWQMNFP